MSAVPRQTVSDWIKRGYLGLRIPRCYYCDRATFQTWANLAAVPDDEVVEVARRVRCDGCGQPSAGLAVVTYRDVENGVLLGSVTNLP